ncbi:MAG: hypothetical protein JRI59_07710 [Deltaproteobacteria bacterium]|nr:hypothetical protein [Deltaproteobacteria bacterium]
MLAFTFYWFLLACELAAIVLLIVGLIHKLKKIFGRCPPPAAPLRR